MAAEYIYPKGVFEMADFYKLLTGIVLAVCAEAVLSSMTENESLKKIISAACQRFRKECGQTAGKRIEYITEQKERNSIR